jgi:hypothetical protein
MKRRAAILLLFLVSFGLGFATSKAGAQEPRASVSIVTKGDLWVGERVVLAVELSAPGIFAGAPAFDLPDPPGMLLFPPEDRPILTNREIDGVSYTVQRHEVTVVVRHGGKQTIPSLSVRLQFKRNPLDKQAAAAVVKTDPLEITAKLPPGAEKFGSLISSHRLQVVEKWSPEPGKAKAGGAFTRTITFTAADVPGMAFPPIPAAPIDGLGVYAKPPAVLDHRERGDWQGERQDTVTYVCKRPGKFTIPALQVTWYNLDTNKLETVEFPARILDVAPNSAMASAAPEPEPSSGRRPATIALAAALAVNVLAYGVWKTRAFLLRALSVFDAVTLAPLNPTDSMEDPANK